MAYSKKKTKHKSFKKEYAVLPAHAAIFLIFAVCFGFQSYEQVRNLYKPFLIRKHLDKLQIVKFINKKRTQIVEKMTSDSMDFPQVQFCTSRGFKTNVLTDIGLKAHSMKFAQFTTYYENIDLGDIEEIWENATYSMEEFALTWMIVEGMVLLVQ